jgi:NADH-quinone oxidoreductase subunit J
MMLDINLDRLRQGFWHYLPLGAFVGLVVVLEMALVLVSDYFHAPDASLPAAAATASNTRELGALLVSKYTYPFELTAALLLLAIVAAVALTFREAKKTRSTDPEAQIRVQAAERMRLVDMPVEQQESAVRDQGSENASPTTDPAQ